MKFTAILFAVVGILQAVNLNGQQTSPNPAIKVRDGYKLTVVENTLKNPRFMVLDDQETLYVSNPDDGEIKTLKDLNKDGYYETVKTFVTNYPSVHGMYFYDGWLYFAQSGAIFRAMDTDHDGVADKTETVIPKGELPEGGGHWWRPILIHNNRLYTAIGCSSNIAVDEGTDRQKIWSYDLTGKDKKLFSSGVRNTEKLLIRPGTDEIWGMDHGSDMFGGKFEKGASVGQPITDLFPPDEMNHYVQDGFYGHPFIVGNRLPRYEFMDRSDIAELASKTIVPEWGTGSHWAPNAMVFYTGNQFPAEIKNDAFVAFHGSWNRSKKAGYCVSRVLFENGHPYGELKYVDFLTENGKALGRPADVIVAGDGSLLITDDSNNKIYRLSYIGKN
ncbi:MAG: PQQ-dependent sugar dehydrogenase [Bacteroidia bacterium]|nr:PQQ-dependent sugar dehydrogenase [Bacteroidia bacterium]